MPQRPRPTRPATSKDIEDFANLIGGYCIRAEQKIDDLESHMKQWKSDVRDQVQLMMDELRRELVSAKGDEIASLKDRVDQVDQFLRRLDEGQYALDRNSRIRDKENQRSLLELEFRLNNVDEILARLS